MGRKVKGCMPDSLAEMAVGDAEIDRGGACLCTLARVGRPQS